MVKISRTIELSRGDIKRVENVVETSGDNYITRVESKRIIHLVERLDYPVNVMYEVIMPGGEKLRGYLNADGVRIREC